MHTTEAFSAAAGEVKVGDRLTNSWLVCDGNRDWKMLFEKRKQANKFVSEEVV